MQLPDKRGYFGRYGGKFVPETLMSALKELEEAYWDAKKDQKIQLELNYYLKNYAGRPTPLYFAEKLTNVLEGPKIYLKREDLLHTGAHKINNTIGQVLLAKKIGKKRIICETGAGQHGVATATAASVMGLECVVYMGKKDIKRQSSNVFKMELLRAKVIEVTSGSKTLKDAINEAIRDWTTNVRNTFYVLGSVVGPHPYPMMIRDFQSIIGIEVKKQIMKLERKLPNYLVACVGGGSNSIGLFYPFYRDKVIFIGVEAGGVRAKHGATLCYGTPGVLHGAFSYVLQTSDGQIIHTHSIAPGLDYPGVGPEHSYYKEIKRAKYVSVTDKEALDAFRLLSEVEGIIPALEPAHAIAYIKKVAKEIGKQKIVIINLSGRGDKDIDIVRKGIKEE